VTGELTPAGERPGFLEGRALAAVDFDGDDQAEIVYGGRKLQAFGASDLTGRGARWTLPWRHDPANMHDSGDNSWATGLGVLDATDDAVPDLLVTSSDTDAYLVDGASGQALWHNERCEVRALDETDGSTIWRTPISQCLAAFLDVGDADGDGRPEIAYGELTLFDQPFAALLNADGTKRWSRAISEQLFWVRVTAGGMPWRSGWPTAGSGASSARASH